MTPSPLGVRVTAGSLRSDHGLHLDHAWTEEGIAATPVTNGAQVLHLSVALCVLNDTYREARRLGLAVDGVAVDADGGFDEDWRSTGIEYAVVVDSQAGADDLAHLRDVVDEVAEIPRAIRVGAPVARRA